MLRDHNNDLIRALSEKPEKLQQAETQFFSYSVKRTVYFFFFCNCCLKLSRNYNLLFIVNTEFMQCHDRKIDVEYKNHGRIKIFDQISFQFEKV